MKKNEELREIPLKNYIILGIIIVITIFILYYFYMWYDAYNESKINMPIMNRYMDVINYNELEDFITENPDTLIYVSVLEDEEIREFEKEFKNQFKNKNVLNDILYLDLTSELEDKEIREEIIDEYSINTLSMSDVPSIVLFDDGSLKSIYSVKDNNYNVHAVVDYINNIRLDMDSEIDD